LHLQWTKAFNLKHRICLTVLLLFCLNGFAQKVLYQEEHDLKPYYFGITLGMNKTGFHTELDPSFLHQDSIRVAEATSAGGFSLGLSATLHLNNRFELRFNPQLMFTQRDIVYKLRIPDWNGSTEITKAVESVITTFPLHLKFNSDRIGNFRVYMFGGGKVDLDLASNAKSRQADEMIRIRKVDCGIEAGMGFNFYFPSFIFSPEIKISNGLNNLHARNPTLNYSSVLDRIESRMIEFTIHLEG
jgi:hypothetical protein